MYGIYANIGGILMVNVAIYSIHGSYGFGDCIHHQRVFSAKIDVYLWWENMSAPVSMPSECWFRFGFNMCQHVNLPQTCQHPGRTENHQHTSTRNSTPTFSNGLESSVRKGSCVGIVVVVRALASVAQRGSGPQKTPWRVNSDGSNMLLDLLFLSLSGAHNFHFYSS